jgi:hypothetical protein
MDATLVGGDVIYPHRADLATLKFWRCPCGAYTGTHKNSKTHKPKGGLAHEPLRKARIAAHEAFDKRWRREPFGRRKHTAESRSRAYAWLREQLGMDRNPHIGFMDEAQCARVVEVCRIDVSPSEDALT